MTKSAVVGGLEVASLRDEGKIWLLRHAASGLPVFDGQLRQRRFAEQARAEFLATGLDFTLPVRELAALLVQHPSVMVYRLWRQRARQHDVDPVTGEYYPAYTFHGQRIPSAAQAAAYRARLADEAEYASQLAAWEGEGGA